MELYIKYRPQTTAEILGNDLAIKSLRSEIENGHHVFLLTGDSGCGKAQPLYSKILTPTGFIEMGKVTTDTKVCGIDGKFHNVLGIFPQGKKKVWEFEFNNGERVRSSDEHLWVVSTTTGRNYNKEYRILTTNDIVTSKAKHKFYLPMLNHPIDFNRNEFLEINPYVLGQLISDGSLSGNFSMSLYEEDVYNKLNEKLKLTGDKLTPCWDSKQIKDFNIVRCVENHDTTHGVISPLKQFLIDNKLMVKSNQKHIPMKYLYSSISDRISLLQGLFDGDGYVPPSGKFEYTTVSPQLANDVGFLLRSLGACVSIQKHSTFYTKKGFDKKYPCQDAYTLRFYLPDGILPFSSEKHKSRYHKPQNIPYMWLKSFKYIGEEECQCIYTDAPYHLYLTDDFVFTHNTTLARAIAKELGGTEMSIHELNSSENRGIDTVREIMEEIRYQPLEGKSVYILDEYHMQTNAAQQAALKMLEECPEWCYFFICTTNPEKVIEAIKTRCSRIQVKPLDHDTMFKLLRRVAHNEQVQVSLDVLHKIADLSEGSSRSGLKKLGQVLNLANDEERMKFLEENTFSEENQDMIELCRALISKKDWKDYMECLEKAKDDLKANPEGTKFLIMSYARTVLKNGLNIRAAAMLKAFAGVDTWRNKEYAIYEGLIDFMELIGDA